MGYNLPSISENKPSHQMLTVALQQVKLTLHRLVIENWDGLGGDSRLVISRSSVVSFARFYYLHTLLIRIFSLEIYPFGSFADFPKLKSITMELNYLIGGVKHPNLPTPTDDRATDYPYPSNLTLTEALPPSIEKLVLSCGPTTALFELLDHINSFPLLKHLEITWHDVHYNPDFSQPFTFPGFSETERVEFEDLCTAAGIQLTTSGGRLPTKKLYHWYDRTKELVEFERPQFAQFWVEYPYEGWEELCEEFECDPATGYRWDMPHGEPISKNAPGSAIFVPYAVPSQ